MSSVDGTEKMATASDFQPGCGDNSCVFSVIKTRGGVGTNGGCRCFKNLEHYIESEQRWNRDEVRHVAHSTSMLAQRVYELEKKLAQMELDKNGSKS